jgi:hypothetical protein
MAPSRFSHDRRLLVHFNVTAHPTAEWTARQILEVFPFETPPKYWLRDRDGIYGAAFRTKWRHEHQGYTQRAGVSLAKAIRRACDRLDADGLSGWRPRFGNPVDLIASTAYSTFRWLRTRRWQQ